MRGNVDTIKERLDIVEVASAYLKLEKSGINYKARCPFHNEKTPSFFISPARQSYYCFGCGAKGDMFTLVQELEGVDFRGALKQLADKAGVELEYQRAEAKTEKDKLYTALEDAALFFETELANSKEAREYLASRGIDDQTIKEWRLGYAPEEWRALYSHLVSVGHNKELLLKAGLIKKVEGDEKKEPYDVFRGRLIFPLSDSTGRVIAFSGRALQADTAPKYLNSPDTALFTKSEVLYGLDKAKEEIRKKDYAILVEGQVDLVLSHQAGVRNTVASSGTAFTPTHLERLKRLSPRILLAFDGDTAGEKAAERSTMLGLSLGMEVKIASLPEGSDPAEVIKKDPEEWKDILRKAVPAIEHFLRLVMLGEKDSRKRGKLVEKKILPLIMLLQSSIERSHFVSMVSKHLAVKEEMVWEDLRKVKIPDITKAAEESHSKDEPKILPRKTNIEKRLMGIILWQEEEAQKGAPLIDVSTLKSEMAKRVGEEYFKALYDNLLLDKETLIFEAESYYADPEKLPKDVVELLDNLTDDLLREELGRLIANLSLLETMKDEEGIKRLTKDIQSVHERMRLLEEKRKVS